MASRENDVKSKICSSLQQAIKAMPDLSAVTMRMLKEKIAPAFGEEWEAVSNEYKAFIKDEAVKLIEQADKSPEKEKVGKWKNPKQTESKSTPATVQKKIGRTASDVEVSKSKKKRGETSGHSSGSDDFREETSRSSGSSKPSMKKEAKVQRKEETSHKKESVQSPEVNRLKSLAKQCGIVLPTHLYKGAPPPTELEKRIGSYLMQKGLPNLKPSPHEISRLKNKLQLERDLEGIDMSNIVSGRRGQDKIAPRRGTSKAAANIPVYELENSSESEDEGGKKQRTQGKRGAGRQSRSDKGKSRDEDESEGDADDGSSNLEGSSENEVGERSKPATAKRTKAQVRKESSSDSEYEVDNDDVNDKVPSKTKESSNAKGMRTKGAKMLSEDENHDSQAEEDEASENDEAGPKPRKSRDGTEKEKQRRSVSMNSSDDIESEELDRAASGNGNLAPARARRARERTPSDDEDQKEQDKIGHEQGQKRGAAKKRKVLLSEDEDEKESKVSDKNSGDEEEDSVARASHDE